MGQEIKKISIWGATGSIGTQTLDVLRRMERFSIQTLTAHRNTHALIRIAAEFKPSRVVLTGLEPLGDWRKPFEAMGIQALGGVDGLLTAANEDRKSLVVNALVGSAGLEATLKAIDAGCDIALANKEVLVIAGRLVMDRISKKGVALLPIDSEHSAVFQCLQGEKPERVRRIILTASGGAFRDRDPATLERATVQEALAHPNWSMGKKVTIDSATLMNKVLEVIEARWLFGLRPEQIEVVIHPQSIVHSMVEFVDGSIKAQLGVPDMRVPIQYALSYPDRGEGPHGSMDFKKEHGLEFYPPDPERFPSLGMAYDALRSGGAMTAALNGADEAAVELFLEGKIRFPEICRLIRAAMADHEPVENPDLGELYRADAEAKRFVRTAGNKQYKEKT